jgi:hypothetical protein
MRSRVGSDKARRDFKVEVMFVLAPHFLKFHLTPLETVISSNLDTSICCWRELKNIP